MTSQDYIKVEHVRTGLDFLVLVLQSSNSFDLNAFFQVLFSLIHTVYTGEIQLMALGWCCPIGFFKRSRIMFLLFFPSGIFKRFSRWNPYFRKVLHFLYLCFVIMGLYLSTSRGSSANVSDHVMTSQDYVKVEHVRTWLLSSSLAKFQQF